MVKSSSNNYYKSVIFIHIPKTGGQTLRRVIMRQYPQTDIFRIGGPIVRTSQEEFKRSPVSRRKKIRLLEGHITFGLHQYLSQPCTYITILRDPVERVISNYLYTQVVSQNMSLDDYVRSGITTELNNGQTQLIADMEPESPEEEMPDSSIMLSVAKKNLFEFFSVVGQTERFDESLILMKRRLGWEKRLYYTHRNVTVNRPSISDISKDTIRCIEKLNEQDIELYDFAKKMFDEAVREQGPSFERELKRFRFLNQVYDAAWRAFYRMT